MKQKVLFVCLGNICRSPMAEEIFRQKVFARDLGEMFEIDSAGTYSGHAGELADPRMREAAHCRGYCLTHRSRPLREGDFYVSTQVSTQLTVLLCGTSQVRT